MIGKWLAEKRKRRGVRARERQLDYQKKKAEVLDEDALMRTNFLRSQKLRQKLESLRPIPPRARVLEVGSGAHGIVFGLANDLAIGVDPLAVDYKRLFPKFQTGTDASTVAAIGEELPFADAEFDVVLSDNVIDHAERPLIIIDEIVRVLKPGGLLYFTVNVHHPIYQIVSRAHGAWNALGLGLELAPFADHTIHLTEKRIANFFAHLPLKIFEQSSTIAATKAENQNLKGLDPDTQLKKLFFKNALFEVIAEKVDPAII